MTVPNPDRAIIATEKLTAYLLNTSHKRGGAKARLLLSVGYRADDPLSLESDLRNSTFVAHSHADLREPVRRRVRDRGLDRNAERQDRAILLGLAG
jgi:hypothetical protein